MTFQFVVADGASLDSEVGAAINERYLAPETEIVRSLADLARLPPERREAVQRRALALVNAVRGAKPSGSGLDAFLREYHLGSRGGVAAHPRRRDGGSTHLRQDPER